MTDTKTKQPTKKEILLSPVVLYPIILAIVSSVLFVLVFLLFGFLI